MFLWSSPLQRVIEVETNKKFTEKHDPSNTHSVVNCDVMLILKYTTDIDLTICHVFLISKKTKFAFYGSGFFGVIATFEYYWSTV